MSVVPSFQPWFLELVRCPVTGARLSLADQSLLTRVNAAIAAGGITNANGEQIGEPLESGLVDMASTWLYPIRTGIPSLVAGEAIALAANKLLTEAS